MRISADLSTATSPPISGSKSATLRPERFRLDGPSQRLDPRTHAFRPDIADIALAGRWFAPHYARPETCCCVADAVLVRTAPNGNAPAASQLAFGEGFAVVDQASGWAWGRCLHDDYVGYVPADALGPAPAPTHRVVAPLALLFANADIKSPLRGARPIGARLSGDEEGGFLRTQHGYVSLRHLAALDETEADPVAVAERLLGAPYLWGGRGGDGIDCSGLVQRALELCGIAAPRDSDMQRRALGRLLDEAEPAQRGDLVFFPGHVGFMTDGAHLLHANAFWMQTVIEPLADVVGRLQPVHAQPILCRKRIEA